MKALRWSQLSQTTQKFQENSYWQKKFRNIICSICIAKETEAQRGEVACRRSHSTDLNSCSPEQCLPP